jgi:hypothetical protein
MNLERCKSCGLPVLELDGQFEKLDSYFYLEDGTPPRGTAGWWHKVCLEKSSVGDAWYRARLRNFVEVRGYQWLVDLAGWSIVRHPRTREGLAFARSGELLSLSLPSKPKKQNKDGSIYPLVINEYNLELDDESKVSDIQAALTSSGTYPLSSLVTTLGIRDCIAHPEALDDAVLRFQHNLRHEWSRNSMSTSIEYGIFIPSILEPYVVQAMC